jgi:hypothetical protein
VLQRGDRSSEVSARPLTGRSELESRRVGQPIIPLVGDRKGAVNRHVCSVDISADAIAGLARQSDGSPAGVPGFVTTTFLGVEEPRLLRIFAAALPFLFSSSVVNPALWWLIADITLTRKFAAPLASDYSSLERPVAMM